MEDQMLTKTQFTNIINYCIKQDQKDEAFSNALQTYTEDKDFTGFFRQNTSEILGWLEDIMEDNSKYPLISWWYYENDKGKNDLSIQYSKDITALQKKIPTPEDLYDTLVIESNSNSDHTEYDQITLAFTQQTQGVKFSISIIDQLIQENTSTGNEGYEERNALLNLVRSKIHSTYLLDSGDSFPLTYPLDGYSLIRKENEDE